SKRTSCSSVGSQRNEGRRYQKSGASLFVFITGTNRIERSFANTDDLRKSASATTDAILNAEILVHSLGLERVLSGIVFTSVPRYSRSGLGMEFLAICRTFSTTSP